MKTTILLACFAVILSITPSEKSEQRAKPVAEQTLAKNSLRSLTVPGFLLRSVLIVNEDARKFRNGLKGVSSITFSINEDVLNSQDKFLSINSMLSENSYKTIVEIIDANSSIVIRSLEESGKIRELVLLIIDSNSIICMSMRGYICPNRLIETLASFAKS